MCEQNPFRRVEAKELEKILPHLPKHFADIRELVDLTIKEHSPLSDHLQNIIGTFYDVIWEANEICDFLFSYMDKYGKELGKKEQ